MTRTSIRPPNRATRRATVSTVVSISIATFSTGLAVAAMIQGGFTISTGIVLIFAAICLLSGGFTLRGTWSSTFRSADELAVAVTAHPDQVLAVQSPGTECYLAHLDAEGDVALHLVQDGETVARYIRIDPATSADNAPRTVDVDPLIVFPLVELRAL